MDQIRNGGIHDFRYKNVICISESFNTNISQQFFYNKITCVNSQHKNTNSKDDFVLKPSLNVHLKDFLYIQKYLLLLPYDNFNLIVDDLYL